MRKVFIIMYADRIGSSVYIKKNYRSKFIINKDLPVLVPELEEIYGKKNMYNFNLQ